MKFMSISPKPLKKLDQVINFLNNLNNEVGNFSCRRAIQLSNEYEITDSANKDIYIYAQALANLNLGNFELALNFYKKVNPQFLNNYGKETYRKFWINYAENYYSMEEYFEALEIIENNELEEMVIESNDIKDIYDLTKIYFENLEFEKILSLFKVIKLNKKNKKDNELFIKILILTAFSLYELAKFKELIILLDKLEINKSDNYEHFKFLLEQKLKNHRKTELTQLEKESLNGVKEILSLYSTYSQKEIIFEDKIVFDGKEYSIIIEREPDWFYGEIIEMNKIRSAGLTIEELKGSLIAVLEEYFICEKNDEICNIPNKITLKTIMESELGKNLHKVEHDGTIESLLEALNK